MFAFHYNKYMSCYKTHNYTFLDIWMFTFNSVLQCPEDDIVSSQFFPEGGMSQVMLPYLPTSWNISVQVSDRHYQLHSFHY